MAIANWTNKQVKDQLSSGKMWESNTITYSFPSNTTGLCIVEGEDQGFRKATAQQQTNFTLALMTWDDLIAPNMVKTTSTSSNIELAYTTTGIEYAHAYGPNDGTVWLNASESDLTSMTVGLYGFDTAVHELGHALGLHHMGNYNGEGSWNPSSYQDSTVLSIMSYFGPGASQKSKDIAQADWVGSDNKSYYPQTPMLNDVWVIQDIYGISTTTRINNTVYGFNSNIIGDAARIFDFTQNKNPILTIFDSGGNDTLNLSGFKTPSDIDLESGAFSSANDMTNNIVIAYHCTIENAIGGSADDTVSGNAVDNRLEGGAGDDQIFGLDGNDTLVGGAGDDTIDGGNGIDTAVLDGTMISYTFAYNSALKTYTVTNTSLGTDTYTNVENFQFSDTQRTADQLVTNSPLPPSGDTTPPTLKSSNPIDNATGVATDAGLTLTFNESVQAGSGNIVIYHANGAPAYSIPVTDTSQVSINGATVTINPKTDFSGASDYYVTIEKGAFKDTAGNSFSGITENTALSFTTLNISNNDDYPNTLNTNGNVTVDGAATTGVINFVDDGDVFKVNLVKDQRYIFKAYSGSDSTELYDPYLTLHSPTGEFLTRDDDSGGNNNAEIVYTAQETGTYFLQVSDAGSETGAYSVSASRMTDDYSFNTDTTGIVSQTGSATSGIINSKGDADLFKITLTAGSSYIFDLARTSTDGLADPYLVLYDGTNLEDWAFDDDSGGNGNASISFTAPVSGTYYLGAMDYDVGTGGYTLAARIDTIATSKSGGNNSDDLIGSAGVDRLYGLAGSDKLKGGGGNDLVDGGSGIDHAQYSGVLEDYALTWTSTGLSVEDISLMGQDGTDNLVNIERLEFANKGLALDMGATEAGGKAALLLGVVLGANSLKNPAMVKAALDLIDNGSSIMNVSTMLVNAGITTSLAGGSDNHHFAQWIYHNVIGSYPDANTTTAIENLLSSGAYSQASLLAAVAELPVNQTNVDLVGLYQTGMVYSPV